MAWDMHRRVLEGREQTLRLEHSFTLASVNNLAGDRGKYEAAEDIDRRGMGRKKEGGRVRASRT
jgi:hypothetical protein